MTRSEAERRARELHDMVLPVAHHASMDGHTRCAKCDKIAAALLAAADEEREACAKVAEDDHASDVCGYDIAAAIRARGENP